MMNIPRQISAPTQDAEAVDRHILYNNAVNDALAVLIRDCGGDVMDFVLSTSKALRMRRIAPSRQFENVKLSFNPDIRGEFCTMHRDEKLSREGDDLTSKEHIAILASYVKINLRLMHLVEPSKCDQTITGRMGY